MEAANVSIRLDPQLWDSAAEQQEARRVFDPWEDAILSVVGENTGKITADALWGYLGYENPSSRTQELNARLGAVMKALKFDRVRLRHNGAPAYHYVRGDENQRGVDLETLM